VKGKTNLIHIRKRFISWQPVIGWSTIIRKRNIIRNRQVFKAYPDARYWYAVSLRANQHFAEARSQIDSFLMIHTWMDERVDSGWQGTGRSEVYRNNPKE
jgi:hypothetical protein